MFGFILVALGGMFDTAGDLIFKTWIEKSLPYASLWYVGGLAIYVVGLIFLIEGYKTQNIAVASALFVLINVATLALVSWFYFNEKLSVLQIIGLGFAAVAILLLELGE